ncbi:acyltransferase family protein [Sphingomonas abietis]|uniref:Acyltransferase n=1 Tax=Sphingomonas abietis TaxID=3012344 RepID=A0ABY7NSI2_9SPHN|nr:acyltransferase [Sphingomonas abietis]WBO23915.1 acyltransferase [Sphingomonas abietis]
MASETIFDELRRKRPAVPTEETGKHLFFLDGWRGIAILFVLIGHFSPYFRELGALGVDVFFVLSGRLMAKILIMNAVPLPLFFVRRITRIFPALIVYVLAIGAVSAVATYAGLHLNSIVSPLDMFAALTMWMNYKILFFGPAGALGHTWSLSVEEHCYLILATLSAVFHRKPVVSLLIAAIAVAAIINGIVLDPGRVDATFWRTDVMLSGLFMSFAIFLNRGRLAAFLRAFAIPAFVVGVAVAFTPLSTSVQTGISAICLATAVNGLELSPAWIRKALSSKPLAYMGTLSYSVYLWQQPFFAMHEKVGSFLLLPGVAVASIASFYFIERPSRAFLNSLWDQRRFRLRVTQI